MMYGFIGRVSSANSLKDALDVSSARTRSIADRVAKASLQNADGFALPADGAKPGTTGQGQVEVDTEMASLADEQLRFEATASLLQKAYQQIRVSIKDK